MSEKQLADSDCASVWFMRLERAKNLNDFATAAEAQRRLKELGVTVRFARSKSTKRQEPRAC